MPSDLGCSRVDLANFIQNVTTGPMLWGGPSDFYPGDLKISNSSLKILVKVTREHGRYNTSRAKTLLNCEVSIVDKLSHPNIAKFLGTSRYLGQRPAIVTTWYPHGNALVFLVDRPRSDRLRVIKGLLEGMVYLHGGSPAIAHGDIRGVNILVNDAFEGVLVDVGHSQVIRGNGEAPEHSADSHCTNAAIRWMAHELINNDPAISPTLASDVWAFGCTFFELLLEKLPYSSRGHVTHVIQDIVREKLPFSEECSIRAGLGDIWVTISRCWRHVPGDRPTVLKLKNEVCAFL